MAKPKPAPLPAGTEVAGYRVVRFLASGGSSIVYQAQTAAGEMVLLKEYLPAALMHRPAGQLEPLVRPGAVERVRQGLHAFLDAARNLAVLQHPLVAGVIDCVQDHETVYLVCPYLEGQTLQAHIVAARLQSVALPHARSRACLSEAAVLSVGLDLLRALAIVHEAGLLHLDIKPSNVLLTLEGALVLLDFDAAQPMSDPGHPRGGGWRVRPAFTPGFSAPEAMAGEASQGPWTDLYAVGACLYACMLGHPPQDSPGRAQSDTVPDSLKALQAHYSQPLRDAVCASLELGMSRRPATVKALEDLLLGAVHHQAAQSRPHT